MKRILALSILISGFALNANAQKKEQQKIKTVIDEVIVLTENGEYSKVLDHTYPALFTLVPKETLAAQMDEIFNSAEMKITMNNFSTGKVGEIKKGETTEYAIVPYNYTMSMQHTSDEATAEVVDMTAGFLKEQFGEDKVKVDAETKTIVIENESEMLAIRDNGTEEWKIIELKADQMQMMEMILPADVYEAVR
jgi:hypothetical protein